jgi:hypothetical protein
MTWYRVLTTYKDSERESPVPLARHNFKPGCGSNTYRQIDKQPNPLLDK